MQVKTILNQVQRHRSFVYGPARWVAGSRLALEVEVRPRATSRGQCSGCGNAAAGYDTLSARLRVCAAVGDGGVLGLRDAPGSVPRLRGESRIGAVGVGQGSAPSASMKWHGNAVPAF